MIIGSKPARAGSGGAEIPKKLLSLLMAAVLALSLAPSAAWAQPEAPAEPSAAPAVAGQDGAPEAETSPAASPEESASTVPQDAAAPAEDVEPSAADEQAFEAKRPVSTPADDLRSESVAESNPVPAAALALSGVELEKPASLEVGAVLEAKAYTGSSYAPTYVDEGVVYTWSTRRRQARPTTRNGRLSRVRPAARSPSPTTTGAGASRYPRVRVRTRSTSAIPTATGRSSRRGRWTSTPPPS